MRYIFCDLKKLKKDYVCYASEATSLDKDWTLGDKINIDYLLIFNDKKIKVLFDGEEMEYVYVTSEVVEEIPSLAPYLGYALVGFTDLMYMPDSVMTFQSNGKTYNYELGKNVIIEVSGNYTALKLESEGGEATYSILDTWKLGDNILIEEDVEYAPMGICTEDQPVVFVDGEQISIDTIDNELVENVPVLSPYIGWNLINTSVFLSGALTLTIIYGDKYEYKLGENVIIAN